MLAKQLFKKWKQQTGVSELNAQLLACSGISVEASYLPIELLKIIGEYLFVFKENSTSTPIVLEQLIMGALFQNLHYNPQPCKPVKPISVLQRSAEYFRTLPQGLNAPALKLEAPQQHQAIEEINLTIKQSAHILHGAIYEASKVLEAPGNVDQLAVLMMFGENFHKEQALHYLVGEFVVANDEGLREKAALYAHFIVKHCDPWIDTVRPKNPAGADVRCRYAYFVDQARQNFPDLMSSCKSSSAAMIKRDSPPSNCTIC